MSSKAGPRELVLRQMREARASGGRVQRLETVDAAEQARRWPRLREVVDGVEARSGPVVRALMEKNAAIAEAGGDLGPPDPPPRGGEVASAASPRKRPKKAGKRVDSRRRERREQARALAKAIDDRRSLRAVRDEDLEPAKSIEPGSPVQGGVEAALDTPERRGPGRPRGSGEGSEKRSISMPASAWAGIDHRAVVEGGRAVSEVVRELCEYALAEKIPEVPS